MAIKTPSRIFIDESGKSVAELAAAAAGLTQDAMVARVELIKFAQNGNLEARKAIIELSKVVPPNPDAESKRKFRKPRRLTKDINRKDRLTLRGEEKAVRSVDGRMLDIKDVLNKGGLAGGKKLPLYVVDAIAFKAERAARKVAPVTPGIKQLGPKQPTEKQLQREAARAQAAEDAM